MSATRHQRCEPHGKGLPEYDSLTDPNMRHYFQHPDRAETLRFTACIAANGTIVRDGRSKAMVSSSVHKFKKQQEIAERLLRDQLELEERVQKQRLADIEQARREETIARIREERQLTKDILSMMRDSKR